MVDNILAKNEKKRKELINTSDRESKHIPSDIVHNNANDEENFEEGIQEEEEEDIESQRAHMAAEILSADVWPISAGFVRKNMVHHKLNWRIAY